MSQSQPPSSQPPYEEPQQQWPSQPGYQPPRRPQPQQPGYHPPRRPNLQPQEWQPQSISQPLPPMQPQPQQSWQPQPVPQSPLPAQQSWTQQPGPSEGQPRYYTSASQSLAQSPPQQWMQQPVSQPFAQASTQQWQQQATSQPVMQIPPQQWSQQPGPQPFAPTPQPWQQPAPAYQSTMPPPHQEGQRQVGMHAVTQPRAAAKQRRSRRLLWVSAGLIGVLLLAIVGFVALSSPGKTTTGTGNQSTQSTQHRQPKALPGTIGKAVPVSTTWTVTLNKVQTSTGTSLDTPAMGHIFLVVNVSIKNTTAFQQVASSSTMFSLQNSTGRTYAENMTFGHSPDGAIGAGKIILGQIAYEVPANMHDFKLQYTPSFDGTTVVQWNIKI